MSDLETAISIATQAHAGQVDKAGQPYILHPLRLMLACDTDIEMIVAVLHDVVEDSEITFDDLRDSGFSETVLTALACLTKQRGERYEDFIERVAVNPLATAVKLKDIKDNLDITRLETLSDNDLVRLKRYHAALKRLTQR